MANGPARLSEVQPEEQGSHIRTDLRRCLHPKSVRQGLERQDWANSEGCPDGCFSCGERYSSKDHQRQWTGVSESSCAEDLRNAKDLSRYKRSWRPQSFGDHRQVQDVQKPIGKVLRCEENDCLDRSHRHLDQELQQHST